METFACGLAIISLIGMVIFLLLYLHNPASILNGFIFDCELCVVIMMMIAGFLVIPDLNVLGGILAMLLLLLAFVITLGGIWVVIGYLLFNAVQVFKREQHNLQNMLSLFIGAGLLVQIILLFTAHDLFNQPVFLVLIGFFIIVEGWLAMTAVCFVTSSFLCRMNRPGRKTDYVIVLGCGLLDGNRVSPLLASRVDVAIRFYRKCIGRNTHPKLVFSGGQGVDETISEAEAMRDYAVGKGVPVEDTLIENKSTTTLENFRFSKVVMDEDAGNEKYRCAYATSSYHVLRGCIFARKAGLPKAKGLGAKTARYYVTNAMIREYVAVMLNNRKSSIIQIALLAICYFGALLAVMIIRSKG